jgi:hypothetical protein
MTENKGPEQGRILGAPDDRSEFAHGDSKSVRGSAEVVNASPAANYVAPKMALDTVQSEANK